MRVRNRLLSPVLLLVVALFVSTIHAAAQFQAPASQTALAIFSDHPLSDQLWQFLTAELQAELASGDPELHALDNEAEFLHGDDIVLGREYRSTISVFLHGSCAPRGGTIVFPHQQRSISGTMALGWVKRADGAIEPFIHVNCSLIAQMLALQSACSPVCTQEIATAIARVILHEWIHIATQNPSHARHGVAQAQFSVHDLVASPANSAGQPRAGR